MKELPKNQLSPKIKFVWRINDTIWLTFTFLFLLLIFGNVAALAFPAWVSTTLIAIAVLYVVCLIVWWFVLTPIRFVRWRYELSSDFLDIAKGIIWRKRYIIPFVRVQNTDTRQGPILRAFGLSSVTVSTAAGGHEIPGLQNELAEQLRDKAAELARIAQEDV